MLRAFLQQDRLEAGCDEAGRGCLAGPVVAAAVILPPSFSHPLLTDSKKLSAPQREALAPLIRREALAWAIGQVSHREIDEINILNASFLAMHRALHQLDPQPEGLLIDGNRFKPYRNLPFDCIVQGDSKFYSIAAASVLAKTYRDDLMKRIHTEFPHYDWAGNKGYPTPNHRRALQQYGASPYHRRSFRLLPDGIQGELF